jgi:hypothetical protein
MIKFIIKGFLTDFANIMSILYLPVKIAHFVSIYSRTY